MQNAVCKALFTLPPPSIPLRVMKLRNTREISGKPACPPGVLTGMALDVGTFRLEISSGPKLPSVLAVGMDRLLVDYVAADNVWICGLRLARVFTRV